MPRSIYFATRSKALTVAQTRAGEIGHRLENWKDLPDGKASAACEHCYTLALVEPTNGGRWLVSGTTQKKTCAAVQRLKRWRARPK
jgi:hypothetical protein